MAKSREMTLEQKLVWASEELKKRRGDVSDLVAYRDAGIVRALNEGMTEREVATLVRLAPARVHQIKEEAE